MIPKQRVVWTDGMLMEPLHFQQQERYLEHFIHQSTNAIESLYWGFTELIIDEALLNQGIISIQSAIGVFPDGTPFNIGIQDPIPAPFMIDENTQDAVVVLSIVRDLPGNSYINLTDKKIESRYKAVDAELVDRNYGISEEGSPMSSVVQLGQIQFQIGFESTMSQSKTMLPICLIQEKTQNGKVLLDENFLPPLLCVQSIGWLSGMTKELLGIISQRLKKFQRPYMQSSAGGLNELYELLLLQLLNEYFFKISHLLALPKIHPERLFYLLLEMLGRLSFIPQIDILQEEAIIYEHKAPTTSFSILFSSLYKVLSLVIEAPAIALQFQYQDGLHIYKNDQHLQFEKLIFIVSADMQADLLQARFPLQTKLGPIDQIVNLIDLQLPGVGLLPLVTPPRYIPYYPNSVYFEADTSTDLYRKMTNSTAIAMSIVGDFSKLRFDVWGIKGNKIKD